MNLIIILVFVVAYTFIAIESKTKINKASIALFTGVTLWSIYILFNPGSQDIVQQLIDHVGSISQIIFFLLGAMTIVELVDSYDGFEIITKHIKTDNKKILLIILSFTTFFLSSVLDNLTTAIVMVTLTRKLVDDDKERLFYIGMIVISANAGGTWTPIGDVTTTMLWIGEQITTVNIIHKIFLPSLVSMVIPLTIISFMMKGHFHEIPTLKQESPIPHSEKYIVFFTGLFALIFVPIFKAITHLPPFLGILFGLSILWVVTEILNKNKQNDKKITVANALHKVDIPSILFFLGILIAVAALEATGLLTNLSQFLASSIGNLKTIAMSLGLLSAIVDNVPLVAATMGMYNFTTDYYFWEFIAYCTGTGGSILIIGSAAGVAAMGIENIDFFWYLKKISLIALIGYLSGAFLYILLLTSRI